jgi:hypothetical protein
MFWGHIAVEEDGDVDEMQLNRGQAICIYMLLLVGFTLFNDKSTNYVDVTYLKYFHDLELVNEYAWGWTFLARLYKELTNGFHYRTLQLVGYVILLQV